MKKLLPLIIIIATLISCSNSTATPEVKAEKKLSQNDMTAFLAKYNVQVDTSRPYYNSRCKVPQYFNAVWQIREIFSKKTPGDELSKYKDRECSIYMFPVAKLPFEVKKDTLKDARAVVISCGDKIICSYIEFISELRSTAPSAFDGKSIAEISGVNWDIWKDRMDSDDNKNLVIYQYYNALRAGNYDEAYSYLYDKSNIKKEDFIRAAKQNSMPYIDFLDVDQYKEPTENDCYFLVRANVGDGNKKKTFEITFDLKKDSNDNSYGGWKIYKTQIK